ncbi:hypothetical protein GJ496_007700 [Pomphorhynchus laevis]|nr:hypothetical protein GJ496_007700 [Pomphorhynchus laevis]
MSNQIINNSNKKVFERPPEALLRGPLAYNFKRAALWIFIIPLSIAYSYKYFVADKRKQKYEDFWKIYDFERDFRRMRNAGVFQSVQPEKDTVKPDFVQAYEKEIDEAISKFEHQNQV